MELVLDYLANHTELVEPITELAHAEFSYLNPGRSIQARKERIIQHLNHDKLPIAFVLFKNHDFAGTISLREVDIDSYSHVSPWLGSVIIVPHMRGQGLGSWMVAEAMKHAMNLGINKWYLFTPDRESFYAKLGWQTIDKVVHQNIPGVVMSIVL